MNALDSRCQSRPAMMHVHVLARTTAFRIARYIGVGSMASSSLIACEYAVLNAIMPSTNCSELPFASRMSLAIRTSSCVMPLCAGLCRRRHNSKANASSGITPPSTSNTCCSTGKSGSSHIRAARMSKCLRSLMIVASSLPITPPLAMSADAEAAHMSIPMFW